MLPPSHTPWPSLFGCVLFVVWRYYISTSSFSSLSVFQLLLWLHKRHVLAVLVYVPGWVYSSKVWEGKQYVHHRLPVRSLLLEGVCLQTNSPATQTGLSSQLYRLKQKKQKGENGQECLRTTREHFRFQPHHRTHILHIRLALTAQNPPICVLSPSPSHINAALLLLA